MLRNILITALISLCTTTYAQEISPKRDSAEIIASPVIVHGCKLTTGKIAGVAIPVAGIAYGFIALKENSLKKLNLSTKLEITEDHPGFASGLDNYLQYSPAAAVYALNIFGVKGKHNFRQRTTIYGITTLITTLVVTPLKSITHELRPDGSSYSSFPSGHTATAFAAAEFMRQEYKDVSPWYGVGGYAAAAATGMLRMYNNKHWFSDIVAGAGIGILSTKLAYYIYPKLQHKKQKSEHGETLAMPFYNNKTLGISFVHRFSKSAS